MFLDILLTLFLVFLNAFFVAGEFAIVKVRASQLELRIREGSKLAKVAQNIVEHLDAYLSATQLGITFASLGLGWIGESVVAKIILNFFDLFGVNITSDLAHKIALPSAFILITILHIVFGELAPKSMAIQRPEKISLLVAIPLKLFYFIFKPFIWVLNSFANSIIKLLGFEPASQEQIHHSQEELRLIIEQSTKTGALDETEQELLENVFDFTKTPIKQIMVPRGKIEALDINSTFEEVINKFIETGYSRIPVYNKVIDEINGIIFAKDLLFFLSKNNDFSIEKIIHPPFFVHEDEKISTLLEDFQKNKVQMAIVIDDFGGVAGIVTVEDIIEEIVGEIQDEYDNETPNIEKISEKAYLVKASATISDINDFLPYPLPESDDYETLGGLIITTLGRIPECQETFELFGYTFSITKRTKRHIEQVKIEIKSKNEPE